MSNGTVRHQKAEVRLRISTKKICGIRHICFLFQAVLSQHLLCVWDVLLYQESIALQTSDVMHPWPDRTVSCRYTVAVAVLHPSSRGSLGTRNSDRDVYLGSSFRRISSHYLRHVSYHVWHSEVFPDTVRSNNSCRIGEGRNTTEIVRCCNAWESMRIDKVNEVIIALYFDRIYLVYISIEICAV
jgi:hypothetical protein